MTDNSGEQTDGRTRRDYLKWIVAVAVGIPVLVEVGTFVGMVGAKLDDQHPKALSVGDELLPSTQPTETIRTLAVQETDAGRALRIEVDVTNTSQTTYGVAITGIKLDSDETLSEAVETGSLEPGASATLHGEWSLPPDATPVGLDAVAREYTDGTSAVVAAEQRRLPSFDSR